MKFETIQPSKRFAAIRGFVLVYHDPVTSHPRGTGAIIVDENGEYSIGISVCSRHDQFVRAVGRAKAVGRAVQDYYQTPHAKVDLSLPDSIKRLVHILQTSIRNVKHGLDKKGDPDA